MRLVDYDKDVYHWASSSSQASTCSFEPGTAEDVAIALQILGNTSTQFAVKGGGHASNPGFSSTTGVQIALYRFSEVAYDSTAQTATIGAGLVWDDVYAALEPYSVNVVGGRVTGVGVAGFTLGGGYSWKTNQYGLTIDTVEAFELVMPNGTVTNVTEASSPDLFFGLKGIVTRFTLRVFPQTEVWGGLITFTANTLDLVNAATANFVANNTDPKAAIITTYNFLLGEVPGVSQILFYDYPTPPSGLFDEFLAIPYFTSDISTRSFASLVQSSPSNATAQFRGIFNTISVLDYPLALVQAILNETIYYGTNLILDSTFFISYDVESFLPTLFTHNSTPSAYPPSRAQGLLPLNIYYAWSFPVADDVMQNAIRQTASTLRNKAVSLGQDVADAAPYSNYAIYDTPLESLYGDNLPLLQRLKAEVDPQNVMGLAGGFKF
ncbi:hypothetical protein SERLA73DRAFT_119696 [Serpula lacrymans var. lacrymans S7.3]|uniref:FAD-binding PCMH-type domain-containing protein n=1 Tax=Serpula lacrymans var. lacrymans (strain S7.3) TaxID=936435 RepID=F8PK02_SERL3|nr:hypothetical protein SERLA73DRAFT_119696 [Serpula lacrymans var. lacrymans S7.3]